jgi:hypothetical protein
MTLDLPEMLIVTNLNRTFASDEKSFCESDGIQKFENLGRSRGVTAGFWRYLGESNRVYCLAHQYETGSGLYEHNYQGMRLFDRARLDTHRK